MVLCYVQQLGILQLFFKFECINTQKYVMPLQPDNEESQPDYENSPNPIIFRLSINLQLA